MVKKHLKHVLFILWVTMIISPIYSQVKQSHDLVSGFLQLKDEFGLGIVFSGIQFEYRYGLQWKISADALNF